MTIPAIWLAKIIGAVLRLMGRRGNALPGLVVERLFPGFLPRALTQLSEGVVVVSGTNGKTTTTKMVATVLGQRYRVLTNDTGSNFVRGTVTAVCEFASWRGRLAADVAVFELDEAHAVRFIAVVPPDRVLLLNVMRDQLDRFGEIDTTAALLRQVAVSARTAVVLNRDDPRIVGIAADLRTETSFYGVAASLRDQFPTDEELYGSDLAPRAPGPAASAELLALELGESSRLTMRIDDATFDVAMRAGGAHNAQNAAGAAAMALTFGLEPAVIADGLRAVEPAFGRGQTFGVDGRRVVLHLVKNPAGFRQNLRTLGAERPCAVVIAINDDYADSRDVSWLWDVDFTVALGPEQPAEGDINRAARPYLITAGTRAADMALRLHYDDVATDAIEPDLRKAVRDAVAQVRPGEGVAVLSTYTAMWALHADLLELGLPLSAGSVV